MSEALMEAIEAYTDHYEEAEHRAYEDAPRPAQNARHRPKRKRTAKLGMRGRNRSRSMRV